MFLPSLCSLLSFFFLICAIFLFLFLLLSLITLWVWWTSSFTKCRRNVVKEKTCIVTQSRTSIMDRRRWIQQICWKITLNSEANCTTFNHTTLYFKYSCWFQGDRYLGMFHKSLEQTVMQRILSKYLLHSPREVWLCKCLKGKQTKKKDTLCKNECFLEFRSYWFWFLCYCMVCLHFIQYIMFSTDLPIS